MNSPAQAQNDYLAPSAIEVLIHYATRPTPHPRHYAPAVQDARKGLLAAKAIVPCNVAGTSIERCSNAGPDHMTFTATHLGQMWLAAMGRTPCPEVQEPPRPLAKRVSPGPYSVLVHNDPPDSRPVATLSTGNGRVDLVGPPCVEEAGSNAELVLEAFQVTEEVGQSPRQLLDRVADLMGVIDRLRATPRKPSSGKSNG